MGKSSSEVLTNNTEGLSASHCRRFCSQTRIVFTNGITNNTESTERLLTSPLPERPCT